jgi:hypothetical protein
VTINTSFWVRNYRGFKEDGAGFLVIKPVNVIVGKNNIGKSSLIAAVDHMFRERGVENEIGRNIEFGEVLTEAELQPYFSNNTAGGDLPNNHWRGHGQNFIGKRVVWREPGRDVEVLRIEGYEGSLLSGERSRIGNVVAASKRRNLRHVRLDADRDLVKEPYIHELALKSNGEGATNIVQSYINSSNLDRDLIQVRLLTALNVIFTPDAVFSEMVVQHHSDNNTWEIYLGEEGKGLVPLSASGSGLKTVILTLLNLLVRPDFEKKEIANYIF